MYKCFNSINTLIKLFYFSSDIYPTSQINHNRPADMVDYRLASITKPDTNQRYHSLIILKEIIT